MYDTEIPIIHKSGSQAKLAKPEMRLVGFKYIPYGLKQFFVMDMDELYKLIPGGAEKMLNGESNLDFYRRLDENEITSTAQKCFKLIHLEGGGCMAASLSGL